MEPRDLWERNTVLAEAFCASDDRVRQAQRVLDQAQADRIRALAAFAVTVGSDGGVAHLMGLNEREVRLARRTVGKNDARHLADDLLGRHAATAAPAPEPEAYEGSPAFEAPLPDPCGETVLPHQVVAEEPETWTPAMDSVLLWSWQSGLDLRTVAAELGLSPRVLLLRAQQLAAEGRLGPPPVTGETGQTGRHRRHDTLHTSVPDSPETLYSFPHPYV